MIKIEIEGKASVSVMGRQTSTVCVSVGSCCPSVIIRRLDWTSVDTFVVSSMVCLTLH